MKIVFMGTPEFAVPSLKVLAELHDVVAVVTAPDKPAGRGRKIQGSDIKVAAEELGLRIMQPTNLKNADFQKELKELGGELFVVVAFRMLPKDVWEIPPLGTINLHGSLLPHYRGAAPINRAIMNGETVTGLTTFYINENIDTGAIIDRVECLIGEDDTAGIMHDKMMKLGAQLLQTTVRAIELGQAEPQLQTESDSLKKAPKIFKEDCQIIWDEPAEVIHNHIRGLSPYPTAFSLVAGGDFERVKVFKSKLTDRKSGEEAGRVEVSKEKLYVHTHDYYLEILEIQVPGKKRMSVEDFLNGYQIPASLRFVS
jgi:methionyl-tRNA formyltransferase